MLRYYHLEVVWASRILTIAFLFIVLSSQNSSAEEIHYDNLTISYEDSLIHTDDEIFLQGSLQIYGNFSLYNCTLWMDKPEGTWSEIRVHTNANFTIIDSSIRPTQELEDYIINGIGLGSAYGFAVGADDIPNVDSWAQLDISNSDIFMTHIRLKYANASIENSNFYGYYYNNVSAIPDGLWSENSFLDIQNSTFIDYEQGFRSIGSLANYNNVSCSNCSFLMSQEWWSNDISLLDANGLNINYSKLVKYLDSSISCYNLAFCSNLTGWFWVPEYFILNDGVSFEYQTTVLIFSVPKALSSDDISQFKLIWSGVISENNPSFSINLNSFVLSNMILYKDNEIIVDNSPVNKYSNISISLTINNPTDFTIHNLDLELRADNQSVSVRISVNIHAHSYIDVNLSCNSLCWNSINGSSNQSPIVLSAVLSASDNGIYYFQSDITSNLAFTPIIPFVEDEAKPEFIVYFTALLVVFTIGIVLYRNLKWK